MNRILSHSNSLQIQELACEFVVYNRLYESGNLIEPIDSLPANTRMGLSRPQEEMTLSSTAIRAGLKS